MRIKHAVMALACPNTNALELCIYSYKDIVHHAEIGSTEDSNREHRYQKCHRGLCGTPRYPS